ncbi:DUF624 domain-containing protein [Fusibacter sp. JL216-2]|uniref:DUF624 domain-containing protein n=1 Tax=Fusibacter sp. JL216-2 TaxID=3071453 RepID=UPI003D349933
MRFFDQDSGLSKYGAILFDLTLLNFIVLTISILTFGLGFGAAVTAMMFSIDRTLFEGRGYALENFIQSFKRNWKQASAVWGLSYALIGLSRFAIELFSQMEGALSSLTIVYFAVIIEVIFILIYALPTLALIDIKLKPLIQQAFILSHKHIWVTLICTGLIGLGVYMTFELHGIFLLFLLSGLGVVIDQFVIRTVLIKYLTDEQKQALFSNTLYAPKGYDDL